MLNKNAWKMFIFQTCLFLTVSSYSLNISKRKRTILFFDSNISLSNRKDIFCNKILIFKTLTTPPQQFKDKWTLDMLQNFFTYSNEENNYFSQKNKIGNFRKLTIPILRGGSNSWPSPPIRLLLNLSKNLTL